MAHKHYDLGHGYFFNLNEDGSADVRNCDLGIVIHLKKESVEVLRKIFKDHDNPPEGGKND